MFKDADAVTGRHSVKSVPFVRSFRQEQECLVQTVIITGLQAAAASRAAPRDASVCLFLRTLINPANVNDAAPGAPTGILAVCGLPAFQPGRTDIMSDKMLIDASHQEETRVVVVRGNRIEEFDFRIRTQETNQGQYLSCASNARRAVPSGCFCGIWRQSPRLSWPSAKFIPDYYQIPVADRQALIEAEAEAASQDEDHEENASEQRSTRSQ